MQSLSQLLGDIDNGDEDEIYEDFNNQSNATDKSSHFNGEADRISSAYRFHSLDVQPMREIKISSIFFFFQTCPP